MNARRTIAVILAAALLGVPATPLIAGADDCAAHQHDAAHPAGHDQPPDGHLMAPQVTADAAASTCPHCPDTSCAMVSACSGWDTGRNRARDGDIATWHQGTRAPGENGLASGPRPSPPTPPPVST